LSDLDDLATLIDYRAAIEKRHGWPTCAQCHTPVEAVYVDEDFLSRTYHIRVQCHGEQEEVTLSAFDLLTLPNPSDLRLDLIPAFQSKKEIP
jgi:hypothetical protein